MKFIPRIIYRSFSAAKAGFVWLCQKTAPMQPYREYRLELAAYPQGTVGREVADFLKRNNYEFIPGFEGHDLKHVLLDYGVSYEEELRLQAFMLGNGNWSPFCFLFLLSGFFSWKNLADHFRAGRKCVSIVRWKLEDVAHMPLNKLRHIMYTGMPLKPGDMKVGK